MKVSMRLVAQLRLMHGARYRLGMLVQNCQRELERLGVADGQILIAVSGGRDSMVLLDLLHRCMPVLGLRGVVGHVNHGLRDLESDTDEAHTREAAQKLEMPHLSRRVDPEASRRRGPSRERPTLEEASRNLRREALTQMAVEAGCDWIATAHHVGDQAETVLLRLLRGTSPDGLRAMTAKSRDGRWLKPLLRVSPDAIQDWASTREVRWREDASNQDRRFARNRLRLDWIPKLSETFNPQLLRALSDFAEVQGRDLEWIEGLVEEASKEWFEIGDAEIRFALEGWESLPDALARRLVRRALIEVGLARDITRTHLLRVLDFLRRGRSAPRNKCLELPGGFSIRRRDECFELTTAETSNGSRRHENAKVHRRD